MRTKSEVNKAIATGVLTAHTTKYLLTMYGMPDSVEGLLSACKLMVEALITIDLGYSCSSEELEAGIAALASMPGVQPEVVTALKVRKTYKEIERLSPEEQATQLKELIAAKFASSLVLRP